MITRRRDALATTILLTAVAGVTGCGLIVPEHPEEEGSHGGDAAHAVHWAYDGDAGPEHWGQLDPSYAACETGRAQSPIDLAAPKARDLPDIEFGYDESPASVLNNGHTMQVTPEGTDNGIRVGGDRYRLVQFHFHDPSEHTVDGESFPMELHLVHEGADGSLAVVGVLIEEGAASTALAPVFDAMPAEADSTHDLADPLDLEAILPAKRRYYRYSGSLTTPPCTQGVTWLVLRRPITLSPGQIRAFTDLTGTNSRPVQDLNGRTPRLDTAAG